jgi:hypothetical protein
MLDREVAVNEAAGLLPLPFRARCLARFNIVFFLLLFMEIQEIQAFFNRSSVMTL